VAPSSVACSVFTAILLGAPLSASPQPPTFGERIDVEVVNVDVVVTDRQGQRVLGLPREAFRLLVDGEPTEIDFFSSYSSDGGRPGGVSGDRTSDRESIAPAETPQVTWIAYVDLLRADRFLRSTAVRQLESFLREAVRGRDRLLVAGFDGEAPRLLAVSRADHSAALRALRRFVASEPKRAFSAFDRGDSQESALSEWERFRRLERALDAVSDTLAIVSGVEGRVAFLYLGGGYDLDALDDLLLRARATALHQRLLERLGESRVTLYSIFAGSERFAGLGADLPGRERSGPNVDPFAGSSAIDTSSELLALATATGGSPFVASSDLADRLSLVGADLGSFYSLGFRPPPVPPGESLSIEVRVDRPGLRVRHRPAARLRSPEERARDAALAALLDGAAGDNPWGVELELLGVRRGEHDEHRAEVELRLPWARVALQPSGTERRGELDFHLAIRGPDGAYRHLETKTLELSIEENDLASRGQDRLRYRLELLLPPGRSELAVTVADAVTGDHSTVVAVLAMPAAQRPRALATGPARPAR